MCVAGSPSQDNPLLVLLRRGALHRRPHLTRSATAARPRISPRLTHRGNSPARRAGFRRPEPRQTLPVRNRAVERSAARCALSARRRSRPANGLRRALSATQVYADSAHAGAAGVKVRRRCRWRVRNAERRYCFPSNAATRMPTRRECSYKPGTLDTGDRMWRRV